MPAQFIPFYKMPTRPTTTGEAGHLLAHQQMHDAVAEVRSAMSDRPAGNVTRVIDTGSTWSRSLPLRGPGELFECIGPEPGPTGLIDGDTFEPIAATSDSGVTAPSVMAIIAYPGDGKVVIDRTSGGQGDNVVYRIYAGSAATGTVIGTAFPLTLTGLTNGTTYQYVATATNSGGVVTSNIAEVTPKAPVATTGTREQFYGFDADGAVPSGLIDPDGKFRVSSQMLAPTGYTSTSAAYSVMMTAPASSARMAVTARIVNLSSTSTPRHPGLVINANSAGSDMSSWYTASFDYTLNQFSMSRVSAGVATVLAKSSVFTTQPARPFMLDFENLGGVLTLRYDGQVVATFTDSSPLTSRYGGLRAYNTGGAGVTANLQWRMDDLGLYVR
jgi:hypothetical protein